MEKKTIFLELPSEMIDKITLLANKVRQASVTKELMDVVGGVEAMKG